MLDSFPAACQEDFLRLMWLMPVPVSQIWLWIGHPIKHGAIGGVDGHYNVVGGGDAGHIHPVQVGRKETLRKAC